MRCQAARLLPEEDRAVEAFERQREGVACTSAIRLITPPINGPSA